MLKSFLLLTLLLLLLALIVGLTLAAPEPEEDVAPDVRYFDK